MPPRWADLDPDDTILFAACHYHDEATVRAFAAQIAALTVPAGWRTALAVADNSGTWPTHEPAPFHVARMDRNLGYYGGIATAVEAWVRAHEALPRWIIATNTDLTMSRGFAETLLGLELAHDVGVAAPSILLPDGRDQNPFMLERPAALEIWKHRIVFGSRVLGTAKLHASAWKARLQALRPAVRTVRTARRIYAPHGAMVLFRDAFFRAGGTLRHPGFMYGEELHVAEQARRLGLAVLLEPRLVVHHRAHAVIGGVAREQRRKWLSDSYEALWREYFRSP